MTIHAICLASLPALQWLVLRTAHGSSVDSAEVIGRAGLKPPMDFCRHGLGAEPTPMLSPLAETIVPWAWEANTGGVCTGRSGSPQSCRLLRTTDGHHPGSHGIRARRVWAHQVLRRNRQRPMMSL